MATQLTEQLTIGSAPHLGRAVPANGQKGLAARLCGAAAHRVLVVLVEDLLRDPISSSLLSDIMNKSSDLQNSA